MSRYSPYKIYLCGTGNSPLVDPQPACPRASEHTPQPASYLDWHEWARRMSKTHRQRRCEGCGRLNVWVPKGRKV